MSSGRKNLQVPEAMRDASFCDTASLQTPAVIHKDESTLFPSQQRTRLNAQAPDCRRLSRESFSLREKQKLNGVFNDQRSAVVPSLTA